MTSANLANAETTHTDSGGPYVRKEVVFGASNASPFRNVLNHIGNFGLPTAGSVGADPGGKRHNAAGDEVRARKPGCG